MNIQVEDRLFPKCSIKWRGWNTSLAALRTHGWDISAYYNQYSKYYVLQLRNSESRLIGAAKIPINEWDFAGRNGVGLSVEIKEIYAESNGRMPKYRVMNPERAYTADDVPELLELINTLLKPSRERYIEETILPEAKVLQFKTRYGILLDEQDTAKKA